ncbi:hypothetical protein MLD38_004650 [Melastoma candidum]|uniref:Uncharacterized protein n=1 Tax=Melastoma candidum TaxID=119954 RepID=A0ACB9S616_9MYRT|nr:hypothetical protein MLD38_004650 [Melastoma candidum]
MTMNGNPFVDDELALISELFPGTYAQLAPPSQEAKPRRRRRRRNRGEPSGITGMKKRKLSQVQVDILEKRFGEEHKLESDRKDKLAAELELDPRQVAVWFQNRRTRYKSKKLEEEYSQLKSAYENAVIEACRLEAEVRKLKERLAGTENENRRLSERLDHGGGGASNSPVSSVTMMDHQTPWPGELVYDGVFFPESSCIVDEMQWVAPFM